MKKQESGQTAYHILNVGNEKYGDCVLCVFDDTTVLIDGGHSADSKLITKQIGQVLGKKPPFEISLLVVTHCHSDHIGCLPTLVENGTITVKHALMSNPDIGYGSAFDSFYADVPDAVKRVAAALHEEDYGHLSGKSLKEFLANAPTVETVYRGMLENLKAAGTEVVIYNGEGEHKKLETLFKNTGMKVLGPTSEQLQACARAISLSKKHVMDHYSSMMFDTNISESDMYLSLLSEDETFGTVNKAYKGAVNDTSIVIKFGKKETAVLLAGDMQFAEAEVAGLDDSMKKLVTVVTKAGPYGFIKLAHHSSYNGFNEELMAAWSTTRCFGHSGGKKDPYHPNRKTLDILKKKRAKLLYGRTDRIGRFCYIPAVGFYPEDKDYKDFTPNKAKPKKGKAERFFAAPAVIGVKPTAPSVPELVYAHASPNSVGGISMFDEKAGGLSVSFKKFYSKKEVVGRAAERLRDAGFKVLQTSEFSINIAGRAKTYEKVFKTKIIAEERPVIKELGRQTTATFIDSADTLVPGLISTRKSGMDDLIEGVAIEVPRYFMGKASSFAPDKAYWHLGVPGDVALAANAPIAHRKGYTGKDVNIAMVDTGHYAHPFFAAHGYHVEPVVLAPGASNPNHDEHGHGTGESANIFAVAPDVRLIPVKMTNSNSLAAFNAAVALKPNIITCSWGSSIQYGPLNSIDQALAASISAAVASGITVIFSAGNGHFGFPGQHPDVSSAGGVYLAVDGSVQASDYASGFMSNIYKDRAVPDLCGMVGMRPKAIYIMLPIEPGGAIDTDLQGGIFPHGDETAPDDGWAAFSGTSAAAPQLAGAAALLKQAKPSMKPKDVKKALIETARDVAAGHCNPATGANPARRGPDLATGFGLVDAYAAVAEAKSRGKKAKGGKAKRRIEV